MRSQRDNFTTLSEKCRSPSRVCSPFSLLLSFPLLALVPVAPHLRLPPARTHTLHTVFPLFSSFSSPTQLISSPLRRRAFQLFSLNPPSLVTTPPSAPVCPFAIGERPTPPFRPFVTAPRASLVANSFSLCIKCVRARPTRANIRHWSNRVQFAMCDNTNTTTQSIADYLSQLLKDRKQLAAFPNVFIHVERLLDEGECDDNFFFFSLLCRPPAFCTTCVTVYVYVCVRRYGAHVLAKDEKVRKGVEHAQLIDVWRKMWEILRAPFCAFRNKFFTVT